MDELQRLRREVSDLRDRMFALNVALAICVVLFMGLVWWTSPKAGPPGTVVTTGLVLIDAEGEVRARLGVEPLGDATLRLYDEVGVSRVSLRAGDDHTTLEMTDGAERTRARLSAVPTDTSLHLALDSRTARLQAARETASLAVVDLDLQLTGEVRAGIGGAQVSVSRVPDGSPLEGAALVLGEDEGALGPELALVNGAWVVSASLHPKDGEPQVFLVGDQGATRWMASDPTIRSVTP